MVEKVEELSPELQIGAFAERQRDVLNDRKVNVHKTWTVDRSTRGCAQFSGRGLCEGAGIEPVLNRVDSRRSHATRIALDRPCLVWIADLVWTLVSASVIGEEHSRSITAIDYEQRESGSGPDDRIQLPVPEDGIGRTAPITAELLTFPEWQVVQDAGGEAVIQIQLRQSPIQFRAARKRIINRARIRA